MADAARYNVAHGAQIVDINMGCPAKKVCNAAAGSALLANEPLVAAIVAAVVRAVEVPVTLKIRTGTHPGARNAVAIARIAEDAGVAALTVHGRTRACAFVGPVEYDTIAAVKRAVPIPVIANGDIGSPAQARAVLARTGADAVMIGRAAQGRPWIFREIAHFLATGAQLPPPTVAEARALVLAHLTDHYAFHGELTGVRTARKHLSWYAQSLPDGEAFRRAMCATETPAAQLAAVETYFDRLAAAGERLPRRGAAGGAARRARMSCRGGGGPRGVTRRQKLNGSSEICRSVDRSLDEYFERLDGEMPTGVYDMVIGHVERALLASIMARADGNQSQAAEMLGMNRNTLRTKLVKYKLL